MRNLEFFKKINPGLFFLSVNAFLATLAFSFVPIFLKEEGLSFSQIIMIYALYTFISVIIAILVQKFSVKRFILFGLFAYSLAVLVFAYYSAYSFALYCLFVAIAIVFFWIPLNYLVFKNSKNSQNAYESSVYIILPGVIAIALPPVSGYVIEKFGYSALFMLVAVLYIAAIIIFRNLIGDEEVVTAKTRESIEYFKGFKTISLIEGSLHFFVGAIIPVYSLLFFDNEKSFGYFLSYLGIIAFIITLVIAKRSDKTKKRRMYLYTLLLAMSASIFALPFATTRLLWMLAVIPLTLFYTVSYPIRMAILLDRKKPSMGIWKAREIFLNIGRAATLTISAALFHYEYYSAVFFMFGFLMIPYIFLVEHKLKGLQ